MRPPPPAARYSLIARAAVRPPPTITSSNLVILRLLMRVSCRGVGALSRLVLTGVRTGAVAALTRHARRAAPRENRVGDPCLAAAPARGRRVSTGRRSRGFTGFRLRSARADRARRAWLSAGARGTHPRPPRGGIAGLSAAVTATVLGTEMESAAVPSTRRTKATPRPLDDDSREWLSSLRATGAVREAAIERLHALLLRAARFEVSRRRPTLPHLRGNEFDEIALEAADDALMSVLARLDDFRGASRFTTWVYKFALLEAAVKLRRRAWQGREVPLEPETWSLFGSEALEPDEQAEQRELLTTVQLAI